IDFATRDRVAAVSVKIEVEAVDLAFAGEVHLDAVGGVGSPLGLCGDEGRRQKAKGRSKKEREQAKASYFCLLPSAFCLHPLIPSRFPPSVPRCSTAAGTKTARAPAAR